MGEISLVMPPINPVLPDQQMLSEQVLDLDDSSRYDTIIQVNKGIL